MALIRWSPKFSVGVSSLDDDHRILADLINRLRPPVEPEEAQQTLTLLHARINDHFVREEALMERLEYPDYAEHWNHHVQTNATLHAIADPATALRDGSASLATAHAFLANWYMSHLLGADLKLRRFFVRKGVADVPPWSLGPSLKGHLHRLAHRIRWR